MPGITMTGSKNGKMTTPMTKQKKHNLQRPRTSRRTIENVQRQGTTLQTTVGGVQGVAQASVPLQDRDYHQDARPPRRDEIINLLLLSTSHLHTRRPSTWIGSRIYHKFSRGSTRNRQRPEPQRDWPKYRDVTTSSSTGKEAPDEESGRNDYNFGGQRWKKRPRYFLINNNRTIITDNFVPMLNTCS